MMDSKACGSILLSSGEEMKDERDRVILYINSNLNAVVAWHWDGDGTLYIKADNIAVINTDCKKDHGWKFI